MGILLISQGKPYFLINYKDDPCGNSRLRLVFIFINASVKTKSVTHEGTTGSRRVFSENWGRKP